MKPTASMPGRGPIPTALVEGAASTLTDEEFAARFTDAAHVLWTIAAGVLGDSVEADDVLQEACVMALSKLDHYRPGTNFAAWMGQFVRNIALNHARKRRRRATTPTAPEVLAEYATESDASAPVQSPVLDRRGELGLDQDAFDDEVLAGLRGLSAMQRSCLLLRTVMDLSYREIARTLEIPEGTTMSHVHRARVVLRERLSHRTGMDVSSGVEMEKRA